MSLFWHIKISNSLYIWLTIRKIDYIIFYILFNILGFGTFPLSLLIHIIQEQKHIESSLSPCDYVNFSISPIITLSI